MKQCRSVLFLLLMLFCHFTFTVKKIFTIWPYCEQKKLVHFGATISIDSDDFRNYETVLAQASESCRVNLPEMEGHEWSVVALIDLDHESFEGRERLLARDLQMNPYLMCRLKSSPIPPPPLTIGQRLSKYLYSFLPSRQS